MDAKILVVNEDLHLRETLKDILAAEGYKVYTAESGKKALELAVSRFFEIIIIDFSLSDKTGIEVIKNIRRFNLDSQIIMLTAHSSLQAAVGATQESVYDFLIKPIDFNYLKRVVKKALEKLQLEQSIKNLAAELKVKNEELTYLNDMKSKFLSMASHDLSNTLMALQISFDILIGGLKTVPEQQKKIRFIKSGMVQISLLINDLVDWACIEKGKFNLEKSNFDAGELVDDILEGPKLRADAKEITMSVEKMHDNLTVCADKKRITQVILNLLENAVRHTPRGGSIKIMLKHLEDARLLVAVSDSGTGIGPEDADKLFESFYQPQGGGSQKGRLGLGLSISKEIITSHNGKIWAESQGKGRGSLFQFTLPLSQKECIVED
jgi:signal transduction histidine kinase